MMDSEVKAGEITAFTSELFKTQNPLLSLWQTLAEHFYPERADFTITRNLGDDMASSIIDSYPVIARRDLCNSFAAMLRDGEWFDIDTNGDKDHESKMWLEWATTRLMSYIKTRSSGFDRATREGDHDFGTFGQAVISCMLNKEADGLLFQTWNLRDCAWWDGADGQVEGLARRWKPTYKVLCDIFGESVHKQIKGDLRKTPHAKASIEHIVMPSRMCSSRAHDNYKYVSIYVDTINSHIIEIKGMNNKVYAVPRFVTISGHPYAYSPAAISALPSSRLFQAMTFTMLESAERHARPPLVARKNVIRGDVNLSSNGITYVDEEYDDRTGTALTPLYTGQSGFPIGLEMREQVASIISSAFYLNKIALPATSREMTATEVIERMKQYRRENLPLFTPMESDYNGQLCELAFDIALEHGFLGSIYEIPPGLQGRDVIFKFKSPLSQADQEKKAALFSQMSNLLAQAAQFDEQSPEVINFEDSLRDAISGMDVPEKWFNSVEKLTSLRQMEAAQMQQTQLAQQAQQAQGNA